VLSVGGTTLSLNSDNTWQSETAWSGSGGGVSRYEASPSYQAGMGYPRRATPDVSYDANPNTGFYIYDTYGYGGVMGVGGTSAGAPQWAALVAIADEMAGHNLDGVSQTLPAIYATASSAYSNNFHDITSGSAGRNRAGTGFDLVTGWGSPIFDSIVPAIGANAPSSSAVTTPPPAAPAPTHGKGALVSVIQVTPVASPLPGQTVTLGIAATSALTANPLGVPMHSSSSAAFVSFSSGSLSTIGGPSSTGGTIGLGQDLVHAAMRPGSMAQIAHEGESNLEMTTFDVPWSEPQAPGPVVPVAPGGGEGESRVPESLKPAANIERSDASAIPQTLIPPQSRLDPLGDDSASDTRSKQNSVLGACLVVGATAAFWNSRVISWRRQHARSLRRVSTHV
jgi:hypothetical protein